MRDPGEKTAGVRPLTDGYGEGKLLFATKDGQLNLLAGLTAEDAVFKLARGADCFSIQAHENVSSPQTDAVSRAFRFHTGDNDPVGTRERKAFSHNRCDVLAEDAEFSALDLAILSYLQIDIADGVRRDREAQTFVPSGLRPV